MAMGDGQFSGQMLRFGQNDNSNLTVLLERKGQSAGEAALILREQNNRAVAQQVRMIALREQIAHFHQRFNPG